MHRPTARSWGPGTGGRSEIEGPEWMEHLAERLRQMATFAHRKLRLPHGLRPPTKHCDVDSPSHTRKFIRLRAHFPFSDMPMRCSCGIQKEKRLIAAAKNTHASFSSVQFGFPARWTSNFSQVIDTLPRRSITSHSPFPILDSPGRSTPPHSCPDSCCPAVWHSVPQSVTAWQSAVAY